MEVIPEKELLDLIKLNHKFEDGIDLDDDGSMSMTSLNSRSSFGRSVRSESDAESSVMSMSSMM